MNDCFSYYQNTSCEYFPCHAFDEEYFNCLFCYCPLYALGDQCGGDFTYNEHGIKDCSLCRLPHSKGGYQHILSKFDGISALAKKRSVNVILQEETNEND